MSSECLCPTSCHSLEGDVGEQCGSGEDGRHAAADVGDEGQDLVVLGVDVWRHSRDVLRTETVQEDETASRLSAARRKSRLLNAVRTQSAKCSDD